MTEIELCCICKSKPIKLNKGNFKRRTCSPECAKKHRLESKREYSKLRYWRLKKLIEIPKES